MVVFVCARACIREHTCVSNSAAGDQSSSESFEDPREDTEKSVCACMSSCIRACDSHDRVQARGHVQATNDGLTSNGLRMPSSIAKESRHRGNNILAQDTDCTRHAHFTHVNAHAHTQGKIHTLC